MRPMLLGTGPMNSLLYRMIMVSFLRVPKSSGMQPTSLFADKAILIKFTAVMLHGNFPFSLLSYKYKISSFCCCQIQTRIEPLTYCPTCPK